MPESMLVQTLRARGWRRLPLRLRRKHYRARKASGADRNKADAVARRIEDMSQQSRALADSLLRARAELDNLRKRTEREREEITRRAGENIISDLLPVMDNFSRAIDAAGAATDVQAMLTGVEMIRDQMRAALANRGLETVEALGQTFDPALHEAVAVDERGDAEENRIVAVLQEGFRWHGRLLRPAMVRVSKRPR